MEQRKGKSHSLPFDLRRLATADEKRVGALLEAVIKAQQENNDTIHSDMVGFMKQFNQLARDVQYIAEHLGVEFDSEGEVEYVAGADGSHDELDGVTANQHHDQVHAIHGPDHTGSLRIPVFPQGEQGDPGFFVPGKQGAAGAAGSAGADGATGAAGRPVPFPGEPGDDGMALPGARGAAGATGAQGDPGQAGADGADGARGWPVPFPGEPGDDGMALPGARGAAGATGATGAQGDPGDPGADGARGPVGPPGLEGQPGSDFWFPAPKLQTGTTTKYLWVAAADMTVDSTGSAVFSEVGTAPDGYSFWLFDDTTSEGVNFDVIIPDDVYPGTQYTVTAYFVGQSNFGASDTVRLRLAGLAVLDGTSMGTATTTQTDNVDPGTAYLAGYLYMHSFSAMTLSGNPGDVLKFNFSRMGAHANDDYAANLRLIGCRIAYEAQVNGLAGPRGAGASFVSHMKWGYE